MPDPAVPETPTAPTPAQKPSHEEKARQEVCKAFQITPEQLDELKRQVGKIEYISIGGRPFIYRTLKRVELKAIKAGVQGGDEATFEENVAARCLVLPRMSIDELKMDDAGLASTLSEAISQFSGYSPDALPVKL